MQIPQSIATRCKPLRLLPPVREERKAGLPGGEAGGATGAEVSLCDNQLRPRRVNLRF